MHVALICINKYHDINIPSLLAKFDGKFLNFYFAVCFFSIITPGFFTILYSMEWGKEKANEWLTTFLMSFFQSVIVVQPLKVRHVNCKFKMQDVSKVTCTFESHDLFTEILTFNKYLELDKRSK